jgi:hypothetical protein
MIDCPAEWFSGGVIRAGEKTESSIQNEFAGDIVPAFDFPASSRRFARPEQSYG